MASELLFEQEHRGDVWRLEVNDYNGSIFANFRKWFYDGDELKPTRQGVTFPAERLSSLYASLTDYLG